MLNSRLALLCATLMLSACHGDTSADAPAAVTQHFKRPPPVKRGPTPEELTAGMVEAVTMGRSSVPVTVKFDVPQAPTVGQPAEITVAVMPQIEADPATLAVSGSDALVLAPGSKPIEIPAVEPTQVYRHSILLTPTVEGVQLLDLSVTLKHDEIIETRQFSVPIIVAPAAEGPASPKRADLKSP